MRRRISIRGCVRPSVGPSVRRSVRRSVGPVLFSRVKVRILGASCAVYPALFFTIETWDGVKNEYSLILKNLVFPLAPADILDPEIRGGQSLLHGDFDMN